MDTKEFKKNFNSIALKNGFDSDFGAWFKESNECILALILRKSNYSKLYYLRIKLNFKNAFGQSFHRNKEWVKHEVAHVMTGPSNEFTDIFDLENKLTDSARIEKLEKLFLIEIIPLCNKILTRKGIIDLNTGGQLFLLPAVKEELNIR